MTIQPHNATVGEHRYESVMDAATGLLGEVSRVVNDPATQYIVMGGWCPYLLNQRKDVAHPGTKDVDLLFKRGDETGTLQRVIRELVAAGYYVSAKHPFQLLRGLRVKDMTLWFNVDLMHPAERGDRAEFVDHFELDIPESSILEGVVRLKSIGVPDSGCLFYGHWTEARVECVLPDGTQDTATFPLVNAGGLVLSKCESMRSPKRPRDAFDVYLLLTQPQAVVEEQLCSLCASYEALPKVFRNASDRLRDPRGSRVFDDNVRMYWVNPPHESPAAAVVGFLERVLEVSGEVEE